MTAAALVQAAAAASPAEAAADALRGGGFAVVLDDARAEPHGVLVLAAEHANPATIGFMILNGRGPLCLCLSESRWARLGLRSPAGERRRGTPLAPAGSIEARTGITTGLSAQDYAHTMRVAADPRTGPSDLIQPGHVFAVSARDGGVVERAGAAEGATDLAGLAGHQGKAVGCAIIDDDGGVATDRSLRVFCARHDVPLVAVTELIAHRQQNDRLLRRVESIWLPTRFGAFTAVGYREAYTQREHLALVKGSVAGVHDVPLYVHAGSMLSDVFHAGGAAGGAELHRALSAIERRGIGIVVYVAPERGATGAGAIPLPAAATGAKIVADLAPASVVALDIEQG